MAHSQHPGRKTTGSGNQVTRRTSRLAATGMQRQPHSCGHTRLAEDLNAWLQPADGE